MLNVENISVRYGDIKVIEKLDFNVEAGEVVSFIGPNGCGKSTLFRCLRGQKELSSGRISWKAGEKAKIASVEQNYRETLLPWKSVKENICFPLTLEKFSIGTREERFHSLVNELPVALPFEAQASQLSGGQAQLTALLRALIFEPDVLFLDEPFSALDYHIRLKVREHLHSWLCKSGTTTFIISHDPEDCLYLSDHVKILKPRPTAVLESLKVRFSEPHRLSLLGNLEFIQQRNHLINVAYGIDSNYERYEFPKTT